MQKPVSNTTLRLVLTIVATLLASCGGGGSGITPAPIAAVPRQQAPQNSAPLLWDAEFVTNVLGFPLDANGDAPPTTFISPGGDLQGITFDSTGRMYVTSSGIPACQNLSGVLVFAPGAAGNAAPVATIVGDKTGFTLPSGIAVDSTNAIYVSDIFENSVSIFAPGSNGNVSPISKLSGPHTEINAPADIAFDASGKLYVANASNAITIYSPGASGDTAPVATISGSLTGLAVPKRIKLDTAGNIYVLNVTGGFDGSVTVYPPGSNGDVAPARTITGPSTGLIHPAALAVDTAGEVFVGQFIGNPLAPGVLVFAAGASGDVSPIRTITHNTTAVPGLGSPEAFAIH